MSHEAKINEVLFGLSEHGEIDTFTPKPDAPYAHAEPQLSAGAIYGLEMHHAREEAGFGHWDTALAVKGVVGGGFLELVQTDIERARAEGDVISSNLIVKIADLPLDWKAVATAGAVFALASGARRATRPFTVGADMQKAAAAAQEADYTVAHTIGSYRHFRRMRSLRDAAMATVATAGAYEIGTQLTPQQNLLVGTGVAALTAAKIVTDRARYVLRGY